jgi:hypothetical protein
MKAGAAIRHGLETEREERMKTARYSFFNEILQGRRQIQEQLGTNRKITLLARARQKTVYPTDLVLI